MYLYSFIETNKCMDIYAFVNTSHLNIIQVILLILLLNCFNASSL